MHEVERANAGDGIVTSECGCSKHQTNAQHAAQRTAELRVALPRTCRHVPAIAPPSGVRQVISTTYVPTKLLSAPLAHTVNRHQLTAVTLVWLMGNLTRLIAVLCVDKHRVQSSNMSSKEQAHPQHTNSHTSQTLLTPSCVYMSDGGGKRVLRILDPAGNVNNKEKRSRMHQ